MERPHVFIVILNYQRWEDCRDCLHAVCSSSYTNFTAFVIDNNSGNGSLTHLKSWFEHWKRESHTDAAFEAGFMDSRQLAGLPANFAFPKLLFVQNDQNDGFAAGNNIVLKHLAGRAGYCWLLNPDIIIERDTLRELVNYSAGLPQQSIIGAVVKSWEHREQLITLGGAKVNFYSATVSKVLKAHKLSQLDYISGGCLFINTSNFIHLGLLPEDYFLYWEETEWCYRAKQNGFGLYVCGSAVCYDKESTSIGKSFMADYYYARNGLLFVSKFRRRNLPLVVFFLSIRCLKRLFAGRIQRAKGIYQGTMDFFKLKLHDAQ